MSSATPAKNIGCARRLQEWNRVGMLPPRDDTILGLSVELILIKIVKQIIKLGGYLAFTYSRCVSCFVKKCFLVWNSMILISEVRDWSECWQLFAGFVVVVGILLSLVFGVVFGNPKTGIKMTFVDTNSTFTFFYNVLCHLWDSRGALINRFFFFFENRGSIIVVLFNLLQKVDSGFHCWSSHIMWLNYSLFCF